MIALKCPHLCAATALAGLMMTALPVVAMESTTADLADKLRGVDSLTAMARELKVLVDPQYGFSSDSVHQWATAVDAAFEAEQLETDFLANLDEHLSDEARQSALDFFETPIGQQSRAVLASAHPLDQGNVIASGRSLIENASTEERALLVDLFEAFSGPAVAHNTVDVYHRAMLIAAEPALGMDGARQWAASAEEVRSGYVENSFAVTAAIYSALDDEQMSELVEAITTPEMLTFHEQSTTALRETLDAALDRLETVYAEGATDS
ncbi:hypothetical protein SAMN05216456_1425 [Devosia crocina]|uniref:DUF2059 domain-containing protein n=1 Tax=Devosia crocina TaxID=429728 RepID=A0A1I7NAL5_9HYPH|nr:hypothetical protein [Devosia crocina]SFV31688.1 hypothetical protein SAMN05216456_1425 [Devosia crocina]